MLTQTYSLQWHNNILVQKCDCGVWRYRKNILNDNSIFCSDSKCWFDTNTDVHIKFAGYLLRLSMSNDQRYLRFGTHSLTFFALTKTYPNQTGLAVFFSLFVLNRKFYLFIYFIRNSIRIVQNHYIHNRSIYFVRNFDGGPQCVVVQRRTLTPLTPLAPSPVTWYKYPASFVCGPSRAWAAVVT